MDLANRQAARAAARDDAMKRLRDLTLAVAIAACGALGLFAWLAAATIPGSASTSSQQPADGSRAPSSQPAADSSGQPAAIAPAPAASGSGFVVSGGSH